MRTQGLHQHQRKALPVAGFTSHPRPPHCKPCIRRCSALNGEGSDTPAAPAPVERRSERALAASLELAWCRAHETHLQKQEQGGLPVLVLDPFATALLGTASLSADAAQQQAPQVPHTLPPEAGPLLLHAHPQRCDALHLLLNLLTTRYVDDTLLNAMAATNLNSISKGDYRQVVLVGDAFDTRPFRLPWPEGTLLFLVAAKDLHRQVTSLLSAAGARVPRGCLLRRVPADLDAPPVASDDIPSFLPALEAAGFQANKLSVWCLQGLIGQGLSHAAIHNLLTDVTGGAAFNSIVLGELPALLTRQEAESLLAEHGLLAALLSPDEEAVGQGRWTPELRAAHARSQQPQERPGEGLWEQEPAQGQGPGGPHPHHQQQQQHGMVPRQRWLFTSQQLRLSYAQMGVYDRHTAAAMEVDEDFNDNFS